MLAPGDPPGFGLPARVKSVPFQCARSVSCPRPLFCMLPATHTSRADVAVMAGRPSSDAGTVPLVISDHLLPFQCRRSMGLLAVGLTPGTPVAQMSQGESATTPDSSTAYGGWCPVQGR